MEGEEARLGLEGIFEAVIPDDEVGAVNLCGEGELGNNHAFGEAGGEMADVRETPALGEGGAGDYDDFIEVVFGGGFKQKGDIDGKPGVAGQLADRLRKAEPCGADGGMKDSLEVFSLTRIGKDNGPKGRALQDSAGVEDSGAKMVPDGAENGRVRGGQLAGTAV